MKNDLVTVIIPVYKVERYLPKCIDSLLSQTYKALEILLIDDGSPDNSGKICDEYAAVDERIRVLHVENGGVSRARNIGLDASNGEFVYFIDSDDYLDSAVIAHLVGILKNDPQVDIAICGVRNINEDGTVFFESGQFGQLTMTNKEALKCMLMESPFDSVCWGKLYRFDVLKNHRFDESIRIAEDFDLLHKVFFACNKIIYSPNQKHNWLKRSTSVTRQLYNEKWEDEFYVCEKVVTFCEKNVPELADYAVKRLLRVLADVSYKIMYKKEYRCDFIKLVERIRAVRIKNRKILSWKLNVKIFIINSYYLALIFFKKDKELG